MYVYTFVLVLVLGVVTKPSLLFSLLCFTRLHSVLSYFRTYALSY